ncbi:DNA-protecting protein DprA [Candidatus Peregrinibacteria bacterium CG_4_10_14_0_2_um_filter_38_24]|nr:MAG: DNA-protecting protein DprA [Candidatus Peregrinibacteria bacterium CG_4_10_14_0_2_um_filter_38_24]PJC39055.1 MAG: DNA-protecting protein DprA [Candidatus Peregrinibacteria bacterium CG_4_9_14_0_2_um_filter_38_9]
MQILNLTDKVFPQILKEIHNPPQKLFYKGDLSVLDRTCIAVVGTRRCTEYGKMMTEKIVEELSHYEVTIVSGLAKGIDTIAHKAAIKNNLKTAAVLPSGLIDIYPPENENLAQEISEKGLLVSEYEENSRPSKYTFPQRNRIISGLSVATLVVEAPEKSGALITARLALEQNREIFVVPQDVDRFQGIGALKLLQKCGAYPVSSGQEIIEQLQLQPKLKLDIKDPPKPQMPIAKLKIAYDISAEEKEILFCMQINRATSLEKIKDKSRFETQKILMILSLLEIKNFVINNTGKYIRKC